MSDTTEVQCSELTLEPTFDCVVCKREMQKFPLDHPHPNDGVLFSARGAYGSTAFDSVNGAEVFVIICDDCLRSAAAANRVGFREGIPRRKIVTWNPEVHDEQS